jgi:L-gulono-1,4-lactone dehydrogenase
MPAQPVQPARPVAGGLAWSNWSGLANAVPVRSLRPGSPAEVAAAVADARAQGLRVKMPGSGHSFTAVALTDGVLLDPRGLSGVVEVDRDAMTVTAWAGTTLRELNAGLEDLGLALHNMGDVDPQTLAGAVSTGTHGSGGLVGSLSAQLAAVTFVDGTGRSHHVSRTDEPDIFDAIRVGLGALGIITSLTFRVEPAFTMSAVETPMRWSEVVSRYDELVEANHHVDIYWFPHTDRCLVKLNNRTVDEPAPLPRWRSRLDDELLSNTLFDLVNRLTNRRPQLAPRLNRLTSRVLSQRSYSDSSHRVFVSPRSVVFREMEYSVPRAVGIDTLVEARRLIERSHWRITFPVEVRCTPPDDAWLSTSHDRESVYLAFHVHRDMDHHAYFEGIEPLLRERAGRPHWGKLHTRTAADLAPVYPRFADFLSVRDRLDPDRIFTNAYLDRVLG